MAYSRRTIWTATAPRGVRQVERSFTGRGLTTSMVAWMVGFLSGEGRCPRPTVCGTAAGGFQWGDPQGPAGQPRPARRLSVIVLDERPADGAVTADVECLQRPRCRLVLDLDVVGWVVPRGWRGGEAEH